MNKIKDIDLFKMEAADYLHLYAGCDVKIYESGNESAPTIATMTPAALASMMAHIVPNPKFSIKLILRRIEDLDEAECILAGFQDNPKKWGKNCSTYHFRPEVMRYLLSIGVDIFNLIQDGLAEHKAI